MASFQALILGSVLFFSMAVGYTSGAWCVCKPGADAVLQKTLDYACGHGADCNPIKSTGTCYNPNSMQAHCSYATNSYYQRMSSTGATCDFSGAAYLSTSDPSVSGCSYPASARFATLLDLCLNSIKRGSAKETSLASRLIDLLALTSGCGTNAREILDEAITPITQALRAKSESSKTSSVCSMNHLLPLPLASPWMILMLSN